MRGKLLLGVGLATGYVLGSRAGRKRYDQIAKASGSVWHSRPVQAQVHKLEDFAKAKAPEVVDFVGGTVKKLVGGSAPEKSAASARIPARRSPAARRSPRKPSSASSTSSE